MKSSDLFLFSLDNLRRRKGRTILTVIGVVIGVCAIIVMISLGIAVNRATDEMLKSWGDLTRIEVNRWGAQQGTPDLDDKMVDKIRHLPGVVAATPLLQPSGFYGTVVTGTNAQYCADWIQLVGIDPAAVEPMGYKLVTGEYDILNNPGRNKIPVLIGNQAPFSFRDTKKRWGSPDFMKYPQYDENYINVSNLPRYDEHGVLQNPEEFFFDIMKAKLIFRMVIGYDEITGEERYKEYEFVPVGMLAGNANDWMVSNGIIMSLENMKKLEVDYKKATGTSGSGGGTVFYYGDADSVEVGGYDNVYVKVDDVKNMDEVEKAIKFEGYQIWSISETRRQMQGQVAQAQMMLGGLAAISLLVAALNIMNTMTMAITERTREIGVMKVLGCKLSDIRRMFLIEAGAIGLIGGIVGTIVSVLISLVLNNLAAMMAWLGVDSNVDLSGIFGLGNFGGMQQGMTVSIIPLWLIILALVFATGVGLLSGIGPANRAVKISSLEAIRRE